MTAFARAEANTVQGNFAWELRSVNHRYLEISFRMPEELRRFESRFRDAITRKLSRGRVDANLRYKPPDASGDGSALNDSAAAQVVAMASQLNQRFDGLGALRTIDVLSWPGVIQTPEVDAEALGRQASDVLKSGLDELVVTRAREGERLATTIIERLASISQLVAQVKTLQPDIQAAWRARLDERVADIREQVDPDRLEQEMVLFLQKSDIEEELDRLVTHVDEVQRVMITKEPKGRRLDFLMQELNREANTLGSKSSDSRLTQLGVELKVLIEQMREQVQNIE